MAKKANRVRIGKALRQGRSHKRQFSDPKEDILKTPLPNQKKKTEELKVDKSTTAAIGVLFVLPVVIILFSLIFLFPYMMRTMLYEEQEGGTIMNSGPTQGQLPPKPND
jgi:ATP-dependent Zn protease